MICAHSNKKLGHYYKLHRKGILIMKNFFGKVTNYIKNTILPIFTQIQWLEIPASTYVRWIMVILVSVNSILTILECNPIPYSENGIYEVVSYILNIAILIVNTYKNNSTSKEALITDKIMRALKAAALSNKENAIGKLEDILKELNGEEFIPINKDHTKTDTPKVESGKN